MTKTTPRRVPIKTPLVVPSFSSRGFPQDRANLLEVTQRHFRLFAPNFSALLVSAFDLHFGYVHARDIPKQALIFVDSGGYESREWEDDSATHLKTLPRAHEKWSSRLLLKTIAQLPDQERFIYVNHDLEGDLRSQVSSATKQLRSLRFARRSFLMKEEPAPQRGRAGPKRMVPIAKTIGKLSQVADLLTDFDVFGVTEKSLGSSYHERLSNLFLLSSFLRKLKIGIPIHVFGALDPLSVRVYAMAGADIFDGLTWLRFAYRKNECVYLSNDILRVTDFGEDFTEGRNAVFNRNYGELVTLQLSLERFRRTGNPKSLNLHPALLHKVTNTLKAAKESPTYRRLIGSS